MSRWKDGKKAQEWVPSPEEKEALAWLETVYSLTEGGDPQPQVNLIISEVDTFCLEGRFGVVDAILRLIRLDRLDPAGIIAMLSACLAAHRNGAIQNYSAFFDEVAAYIPSLEGMPPERQKRLLQGFMPKP